VKKKQKKKQKRKYNPRKHAKHSPSPAVNPLQQRLADINRLKPIMEAAQRTAERRREREHEQETKNQ